MFDFYKPKWLYEVLPFLYAVSGVATILTIKNNLAWISGLLLISAGGVVWKLRRGYRRQEHGQGEETQRCQ